MVRSTRRVILPITVGSRSRPDIRQVAAEAGVSTATVSRVLTGKGPASEAAILQVKAAAQRLGYSPSVSASSLRTERSMIIGVLVPNLANPVFLPFLRSVEHLAQQFGYAVIVADAQRSAEVERHQLDRLSAQRIDALVVAGRPSDPDPIRRLADAGLPVADADHFAAQADAHDSSLSLAVDRACEDLATHGHQRLAFLARRRAPGGTTDTRWRLIESAAANRDVEAIWVPVGTADGPDRDDPARVATLLAALVRSPDGPTVLWSSSHTLTPHLLQGLSTAGVALPDSCSFLTFGDSPWAAAYRPSISVVTTDLGAIGAAMTEGLLHRMGVLESAPDLVLESDRYVARDSVGPAPQR